MQRVGLPAKQPTWAATQSSWAPTLARCLCGYIVTLLLLCLAFSAVVESGTLPDIVWEFDPLP